MWFLENGSERYALPLGTVLVGRGVKEGPFGIILADLTVSREHGALTIEAAPGSSARERPVPEATTVQLTDRSTAGSYVNGDAVKRTTVHLAAGDKVRFGGPSSPTFQLVWHDFVVSLSSRRLDEKGELAEAALKLGLGRFISPGPGKPRPTHCVSAPELASKSPLLLAMLQGSQIVTLDWLKGVLDPSRPAGRWPEESKHRPRAVPGGPAPAGVQPTPASVQALLEAADLDKIAAAPPLTSAFSGVFVAFGSVGSAFYSHVFSLATDAAGGPPPVRLLPPPAAVEAAAARGGACTPDAWLPAAAAEHGPAWAATRAAGSPLGAGVAGVLVQALTPLAAEAAAAVDKLVAKHGFVQINELDVLSILVGKKTLAAVVAAAVARDAAAAAAAVEAAAAEAAAAEAAAKKEAEEAAQAKRKEEAAGWVRAPVPAAQQAAALPAPGAPGAAAAGDAEEASEDAAPLQSGGVPDVVRSGSWVDLIGQHKSYARQRRSVAAGGVAPPKPARHAGAAAAPAAANDDGKDDGKRARRPRAAAAAAAPAPAFSGGFDIDAADMEADAVAAAPDTAAGDGSTSGESDALQAYLRSHEAEAYRVIDDVPVRLVTPPALPQRSGSASSAPAVPTFQAAVPQGMERYYGVAGGHAACGGPNFKRFRKTLPVVWRVSAAAIGVQDKRQAVPILAGNAEVAAALAATTAVDAELERDAAEMFQVAEYAALAGKKRLTASERAGVARLGAVDDIEGDVTKVLTELTGGLLDPQAAAAAAASKRPRRVASAVARDDDDDGGGLGPGLLLESTGSGTGEGEPAPKRPRVDAGTAAAATAPRGASAAAAAPLASASGGGSSGGSDDDDDILEVLEGSSSAPARPPPPPPPAPAPAGMKGGMAVLARLMQAQKKT